MWGAFLTYQVVRVTQFGLRLIWNQRDPRKIRRKRQIWGWMWRWSSKRLAGQRDTDINPDDVVWSSSWEARKYSRLDYSV